MDVIVCEISEGIAYYPELAEWVRSLGLDPDDKMFNALSLMDGDPDIIKCNGNKMYFIDTVIGDIRFVLTSNEVNPKEKEMLSRFHGENRDDFYESPNVAGKSSTLCPTPSHTEAVWGISMA